MDVKGVLYAQIYEQLRERILQRELPPQTKLPSSRELAAQLQVSRSSVINAYDQLLAEGYVVSRQGSGTYVAELAAATGSIPPIRERLAHQQKSISANLSSLGQAVNQAFAGDWQPWNPRKEMRFDFRLGSSSLNESSQKVWRRLIQDSTLHITPHADDPHGYKPLRSAIAEELRANRRCQCNSDNVVIVNGSQQAFDLLTRLLVNPGEHVALEKPGYIVLQLLLAAHQASPDYIDVDEEGMCISQLGQGRNAPKYVHVTPSHQFPTGVVMSLSRRLELIEWANKSQSYIIEDDYDGEFRYIGKPIESLQGLDANDRTIYAGTFSKVLFPNLRLGYLVLPHALVKPFVRLRWLSDFQSSDLQQIALARWLNEGHHHRHLRRMSKTYSERRVQLLSSIRDHFSDSSVSISGDNAGMHIVLYFNTLTQLHLKELIQSCASASLGVVPMAPGFDEDLPVGLTLAFSSIALEDIDEGVATLARLYRSVEK